MKHFLELIRWRNIAIIIFTQWFAYMFLSDVHNINLNFNSAFWLVCLATICIAAAGYMINDYSDIRIDVVNKPEKLIVDKYISRRRVLALHLIFNATGVLLGVLVNYKFSLVNFLVAFVLWQYSIRFKFFFFTGNIIIAALMALTIIVVDFATPDSMFMWLVFYAVFAFLTGLIREIIKDIEDQEGDARFGANTLPIAIGIPKTKIIIYYLMLLTLSILILSCAYLFFKGYIILPLYLIFFTALPLAVFFQWTISADSKSDFARLSTMIKLIMLAGVVSMGLRMVL